MKDSVLVMISLGTSFFGLAILMVCILINPDFQSYEDAARSEDGTHVRIQGKITNTENRGNLTIVSIESACSMEGVIFEDANITEKECVRITGIKDSYNNNPQIVIKKITAC